MASLKSHENVLILVLFTQGPSVSPSSLLSTDPISAARPILVGVHVRISVAMTEENLDELGRRMSQAAMKVGKGGSLDSWLPPKRILCKFSLTLLE